jgi:amidase
MFWMSTRRVCCRRLRMKQTLQLLSVTVLYGLFAQASAIDQEPFEVVETTIAETQQALLTGQTTCHALAVAYLTRIAAFDQKSRLNSIAVLNPDYLKDADACDKEIATTHKLRKLTGITIVVKDNYDTRGLQTTGGSLAMKGFQPLGDATIVAKLRAAGALIVGKSNMAEWAFSPYVTVSSIAGVTRNPYDLGRVPAGSSGGTAAAVSANLAEAGLGTDTGNSIRGPSSHTDLVGIRPSLGLTSRNGIIPLYSHNDVGGPMARSVADAATLLTVIAGYDSADVETGLVRERPPEDYTSYLDPDGLRGARIGVFRRFIDANGTDPEVKKLSEAALEELKKQGAILIDPFDLPDYDALTKNLWCGDFQADLDAYLDKHPNAPFHNLSEIVDSGLYLPYIEEEITNAVHPKPGSDDRITPCPDLYHDPPKIKFRSALLAAMDRAHLDAIVYPTWSDPPRKVGDSTSPAGDNSQILSPQTGFPAITVPIGFTYGMLPAGFTFVGRSLSEGRLIQLAYSYEQSTHHRKPPPLFPAIELVREKQ